MNKAANKIGWKKLPEDVRLAAILEAAACCFMKNGYHSASMQDVADAAGLTKGGLYHHFPSKEAIRDKLIDQFLNFDRLGLAAVLGSDKAPDHKLISAGLMLLEKLATKQGSAPRFIAEAIACSAQIDTVKGFYEKVESLFASLFNAGQQDGTFKLGADPKTLASLYMAVLDGLQIRQDMKVSMKGGVGDYSLAEHCTKEVQAFVASFKA
ncbi:MAG: TetR family transcriptional regulator [Kordiimonadales bacterium]|nr:MAG: TetR family transcriptional regulator [Kordiimonadales bacterium]